MTFSGKQRGESIMLLYLSRENASEAMRVYRWNNKLKRGSCSVKSVRNLVKRSGETWRSCDRPRSGRPHVPAEVAAEMHYMMTIGPLHTARNVSRNLDVPKTTVLQILRSVLQVFPHRFQRVQELEPGNNQQRTNFFLIRYDEGSRSLLRIMKGWGTFHPHWETPRIAFNGRKKTLAVWH